MTETPLSSDAQELLAALKRARSPTHDGAAVLAAVRESTGAQGGSAAAGTAKWAGLRVLVPGVFVVLAGVGGAIGVGTSGAGDASAGAVGVAQPPMESPEVATHSTTPSRPSAAADVPRAGADAERKSAMPASEAADLSVREAPAPRRGRASRRSRAAQPPARSDGLAAELRLLEAARVELAGGRLAKARGLLRQHAEAFGAGRLVVERKATRVLVECAAASPDAAERAAAFLRAHPGSAYGAKIRSRCRAVTKATPSGQGEAHDNNAP